MIGRFMVSRSSFWLSALLLGCATTQKNSEDDLLSGAELSDLNVTQGSTTLAPGDSLELAWTVSAPGLYQIQLSLSLDELLDDTDERIVAYGCGSGIGTPPPECSGGTTCRVEADELGPSFSCGDPESPTTYPVRLEPFLGDSAGNAVLIVRACNALFEGCDEASTPLTFAGG